MSCPDKSVLLHGMLDGELDVVGALAFEAHLKECPACAAEYRRQQAIRMALRRPELRDRAPEALRRKLEAALQPPSVPWWRRFLGDWRWGGAGAAVLAMALMLLVVLPRGGDDLARQLVDSHVRSLLAEHLVDVPSSDRHTVKPWFVGKIDFAPPVTDLSAEGFALAGGRLDYVAGRPAAALVYRRRLHTIDLFVWPDDGDTRAAAATVRGFHIRQWSRGGMSFRAVSDLGSEDLDVFVRALQR